MKGWLMRLFGRDERRREPAPPDPEAIRDEMTRTDPDYARVRHALHEARNLQAAKRSTEEIIEAARRHRRVDTQAESWRRGHADG